MVAAWEEHSDAIAPEWLRESLTARSRRGMLYQDLAWFGSSPPLSRPALPPLQDLPDLLGAMYVMEGSTLGGQLIARKVEATLCLQRGAGNSYFVGHGDLTGVMWKKFCQILMNNVSDSDTEAVIQGAKAMFMTFGLWMRAMPAPDGS